MKGLWGCCVVPFQLAFTRFTYPAAELAGDEATHVRRRPLRLSIGIEDVENSVADLEQAAATLRR